MAIQQYNGTLNDITITTKGKEILGKIISGESFNIYKVKIGTGTLPSTEKEEDQTDLITQFKEIAVNSVTPLDGGGYQIEVVYDNLGVTSLTNITELGIYMADATSGETLYAYSYSATPLVLIPESKGVVEITNMINVYLVDGDAVTATIDKSLTYVTIEDLEAKLKLKMDVSAAGSGFGVHKSDAIDSDDSDTVATSKAVHDVNVKVDADKKLLTSTTTTANNAVANAKTAQDTADAVKIVADGALPADGSGYTLRQMDNGLTSVVNTAIASWSNAFNVRNPPGTLISGFGVCGGSNKFDYTYMATGTNTDTLHSSLNALRVYSTYPAWGTQKLYHEGHKPSAADVGLSHVKNYGITDSTTANSSSTYASSKAVTTVHNEAHAASTAAAKANALALAAQNTANTKISQTEGDTRYPLKAEVSRLLNSKMVGFMCPVTGKWYSGTSIGGQSNIGYGGTIGNLTGIITDKNIYVGPKYKNITNSDYMNRNITDASPYYNMIELEDNVYEIEYVNVMPNNAHSAYMNFESTLGQYSLKPGGTYTINWELLDGDIGSLRLGGGIWHNIIDGDVSVGEDKETGHATATLVSWESTSDVLAFYVRFADSSPENVGKKFKIRVWITDHPDGTPYVKQYIPDGRIKLDEAWTTSSHSFITVTQNTGPLDSQVRPLTTGEGEFHSTVVESGDNIFYNLISKSYRKTISETGVESLLELATDDVYKKPGEVWFNASYAGVGGYTTPYFIKSAMYLGDMTEEELKHDMELIKSGVFELPEHLNNQPKETIPFAIGANANNNRMLNSKIKGIIDPTNGRWYHGVKVGNQQNSGFGITNGDLRCVIGNEDVHIGDKYENIFTLKNLRSYDEYDANSDGSFTIKRVNHDTASGVSSSLVLNKVHLKPLTTYTLTVDKFADDTNNASGHVGIEVATVGIIRIKENTTYTFTTKTDISSIDYPIYITVPNGAAANSSATARITLVEGTMARTFVPVSAPDGDIQIEGINLTNSSYIITGVEHYHHDGQSNTCVIGYHSDLGPGLGLERTSIYTDTNSGKCSAYFSKDFGAGKDSFGNNLTVQRDDIGGGDNKPLKLTSPRSQYANQRFKIFAIYDPTITEEEMIRDMLLLESGDFTLPETLDVRAPGNIPYAISRDNSSNNSSIGLLGSSVEGVGSFIFTEHDENLFNITKNENAGLEFTVNRTGFYNVSLSGEYSTPTAGERILVNMTINGNSPHPLRSTEVIDKFKDNAGGDDTSSFSFPFKFESKDTINIYKHVGSSSSLAFHLVVGVVPL